jgi:serine/threonine-protein kinase
MTREKENLTDKLRPLRGRILGERYHVGDVLGLGGMCALFEAEDAALGRPVALKTTYATSGPQSELARRLRAEAHAAACIRHPNVCQVNDLGRLDDGTPFVVMERLQGETLLQRMTPGEGLPVEEALDIITQLLCALGAAHEKGVVHRDVKPSNVFLVKRSGLPSLVKLIDFGAATRCAFSGVAKDDFTQTGMIVGTQPYLSPEQVSGKREFDRRLDIYAAGIVLYEMLAGERPFRGPSWEKLSDEILHRPLRPLREFRPELPWAIEIAVMRALDRTPSKRFQTAQEMIDAVAEARAQLHGPEAMDAPTWQEHADFTFEDETTIVRKPKVPQPTARPTTPTEN